MYTGVCMLLYMQCKYIKKDVAIEFLEKKENLYKSRSPPTPSMQGKKGKEKEKN